jgi:hypothetical protein
VPDKNRFVRYRRLWQLLDMIRTMPGKGFKQAHGGAKVFAGRFHV